MKNLFKSLMLVAVAAMAFTACQNEPEVIVNNGAESTTITFDATFADTRSQFGEKDGEGYPSTWTEGDEAKFTAELSNGDPVGTLTYTAAIDADDRFSVDFTGGINVGNIVNAYAPASAWDVVYSYEYDANWNLVYFWENSYSIPSTQTPSATSVDPKAHILKATTTYEGNNSMTLNFEHQVAYGKLSLDRFAGTGVNAVVLDINGAKYTIKTTATEDIWFACEPATVQNMTVTVSASEGSFPKQIVKDSDKPLAFNKGRVSTFTVDMTDVTVEGEGVDTSFEATYIYDTLRWDGTRMELSGNNELGTTTFSLNTNNRPGNNSITLGEYTYGGYNVSSPAEGTFSIRYLAGSFASSGYANQVNDAVMTVAFADGKYEIIITFNNAQNAKLNGKTIGYKGMPDGWSAPGKVKTALATPEVTAEVVDDKNVTVTWNEVANADNYTVSVNGVEKEAANTTRTYTIEGEYSTQYTITVVANPAVDSEDYKASAAGSATVTTSADPNAGGGEEPEEPEQPGEGPVTYDPWAFNATLGAGNFFSGYTVTLAGTGANTDVIILNGVKINDVNATPSSATINGNAVSEISGGARVDSNSYNVIIDITLDGTTYRGTSSNTVG